MSLSWMGNKRKCARWRSQGSLANAMAISGEYRGKHQLNNCCGPWLNNSGFISQKVLPTSSGRIAEEPQLILGRVRLFEIGLKGGALPCPILATPTSEPGA